MPPHEPTPLLWYWEQMGISGWSPVAAPVRPDIKVQGEKLYLKTPNGANIRIREKPKEINVGHQRLGLSALHAVYSPDGKFQGTQK